MDKSFTKMPVEKRVATQLLNLDCISTPQITQFMITLMDSIRHSMVRYFNFGVE